MAKHKHLEKSALLKISVFGVLFIVSVMIAFVGLSMNSQEAKQRYETLIAVDQAGGDVETALDDLRTYIYRHMNTQIGSDLGINPPIQLRGTYERLVAAEEARRGTTREKIYEQAQQDCERRQPTGFSGSNRLTCIEAYVDANSTQTDTVEEDLYKFDFASPVWSPDLAGFSILAASVFGLAFTLQVIIYFRIKHMVKLAQ